MISYAFENVSLLTAVGIVWDLSGGLALSAGLIIDDGTLRRRAGSYWGSSPPAIRGLIEQRLDAKFGLLQLLLGFSLQLLSAVGIGIGAWPALVMVLAVPLGWLMYRSNFHYWVSLGSLRHAAIDSSEESWRSHFRDVPDITWRAAVVQLGLTFKPPKSNA